MPWPYLNGARWPSLVSRHRLIHSRATAMRAKRSMSARQRARPGSAKAPTPCLLWGHERPKGDVRVESVRLPTADIGRRGPSTTFPSVVNIGKVLSYVQKTEGLFHRRKTLEG